MSNPTPDPEEPGMIAGMEGPRTRDQVRDRRIERIVELVSPATPLEELPLGDARAAAVVRGREQITSVLDGTDDAARGWRARAASTTPRRPSTMPSGWRALPLSCPSSWWS